MKPRFVKNNPKTIAVELIRYKDGLPPIDAESVVEAFRSFAPEHRKKVAKEWIQYLRDYPESFK